MERSTPSEFWTGVLDPKTDWPARWITSPTPERYASSDSPFVDKLHEYKARCFARRFGIPSGSDGDPAQGHDGRPGRGGKFPGSILRAQLCVSAMGVYEAWINGSRAGCNIIDPAVTDYSKRLLYSAYEVTDRIEKDNLMILIAGNGRHLEAYGYGVPRVSALLVAELADGRRTVIATDDTWLCGGGPIRENGIYYGELYDARQEIPDFATTAQDLGAWVPVAAGQPRSTRASSLSAAGLEPVLVLR